VNINDLYPSKWLKAEADLEDGDLTLTIASVKLDEVGGAGNSKRKPVVYFEETDKGLVLNKTNAGTVQGLYGGDTDNWIGKQITLFATEVDFQGKQVLSIRVRTRKPKAGAQRGAAQPELAGVGARKPDPRFEDDEE
jgi:hypothetical protein